MHGEAAKGGRGRAATTSATAMTQHEGRGDMRSDALRFVAHAAAERRLLLRSPADSKQKCELLSPAAAMRPVLRGRSGVGRDQRCTSG